MKGEAMAANMSTEQKDFYQALRRKIKKFAEGKGKSFKWVEWLLFAPDLFHLLCKLTINPDVPVKEKAKLAGAIAYFVLPFDLIPEGFVGPVGYVDDIAFACCVLNSIINNLDKEIILKHWVGERDVLEVIQSVLAVADKMIGVGRWRKLKEWIEKGKK